MAILVVATAFFVAIEFALMAVDRNRIEAQAQAGDSGARGVLSLLERLSFCLSSAQLGISITGILLGFLARPVFSALVTPVLEPLVGEPGAEGISVATAIIVSTLVIMVVGELIPKSIAISRPDFTSRLLTRPMRLWNLVMYPFVYTFDNVANWIVRRLGVEPREELDHKPDIEELEALIITSGEEGALDPEDVELLTRTIRFHEKVAADALTPRVNVTALASTAPISELISTSIDSGFSRFPIYGRDLDDVLGVAHVKSIYTLPASTRRDRLVTEVMSPVLAVPETRDLDDLFSDLRANRDHLAVVVDEHGGTAGIITLEDLLEEIVGEIDDEYDTSSPEVSRVEEPGNFRVSAALHPDEVEEACGFEMPEGPYETLAGFVLVRLGKIPSPGELFEHDGWRVEVLAVDRLRITTVRLAAPGAWTGPRRAKPSADEGGS